MIFYYIIPWIIPSIQISLPLEGKVSAKLTDEVQPRNSVRYFLNILACFLKNDNFFIRIFSHFRGKITPGDKMEKIKKDTGTFLFGAVGYVLLETLWRGHSHWSMAAAGGISLLLLLKTFRKLKNAPHYFKAIIGGGIITAVEFVFGIIFNIMLGMGVWDYSAVWGNIMGQICPVYSVFWCAISFAVSVFEKKLSSGKIFLPKKALP